jgi:hypothetical protein
VGAQGFAHLARALGRLALPAGLLVALAIPQAALGDTQGPDYITSDNVEFVKSVRAPSGLTAGARVIGHYMYVTSSKDLEIYDISKPEDPQMVGSITANIQFENEEVPTNGKLLGISSDLINSGSECLTSPPTGINTVVGGGCLRLYDVRDPANVKELPSVPGAGDHTSTCILDCSYFYGSAGSITDARDAFKPGGKAVKLKENWKDAVAAQGYPFKATCHNVHEVRPGIVITACQPYSVLSVLPQDGGSITKPKVLATGSTPAEPTRFIHSARWPREGADKFALVGGETNFKPQCDNTRGAFMTVDASQALSTGKLSTPLDELRPVNGTYLDSNPPGQILGCSVHWFEEHGSFQNGGLVALAEYENGTRFLQIKPDGKIVEQGFFIALGGAASAPHWAAPDSDILYSIDYERGFDVLRYKGEHYVPGAPVEPGKVAGTEGRQPSPGPGGGTTTPAPACARASGFQSVDASARRKGVRFSVIRRRRTPFSAEVFQVSKGRRIFNPHPRVARFTNRTGSFTWTGKGASDGWYFARVNMPLQNGKRDIRYLTLNRKRGHFSRGQAFWVNAGCAALAQFKLSRPVFGGTNGRSLGIAYRLTQGVDSVSVTALRGKKVVRRFRNTGRSPDRKIRLSLPAKGIPRGSNITVRIKIQRAGATEVESLGAKRL